MNYRAVTYQAASEHVHTTQPQAASEHVYATQAHACAAKPSATVIWGFTVPAYVLYG